MDLLQWMTSVLPKGKPGLQRQDGMARYCRFNTLLAIAALSPVAIVGLFNVVIDPYGIFNSPKWVGINDSKPVKERNGRLFKAVDITRIRPVTILLGSSRTNQGLNPQHPAFTRPAYNLGLNGANIYEIRRYIQHALVNQRDLKTVVLGIDFFMFDQVKNEPDFSEHRLEKTHLNLQDAINGSLSLNAILASQETIATNIQNPIVDEYARDGFMPHRNPGGTRTEWRFRQALKVYFQLHSDYSLSTDALTELKRIVDLCKQHEITLKIFISPAHATDLEAIYLTGKWSVYEQWKREVVRIVSVWDFSGFNSITTEPISSHMTNYVDYSHYRPEIGDLLLNRLFNYQEEMVPADFGVYLTPNVVESQIVKTYAALVKWEHVHPDEKALVQQSKQ